MRVLIVEDEPYLAEADRDGLRLEAIAADIAGDGATALELLGVNSYDLAVLDRDVPGPSGDEVARRIVASGSGIPILMLTAADRIDDKASGFELGADDYLTKPFQLRELVLRLRALDHRRAHNRPPVRELAGLRVDPFRREVCLPGRALCRAEEKAVRRAGGPGRGRGRDRERRGAARTGNGTRTPIRSPTPYASPSRRCASGSASPGSSPGRLLAHPARHRLRAVPGVLERDLALRAPDRAGRHVPADARGRRGGLRGPGPDQPRVPSSATRASAPGIRSCSMRRNGAGPAVDTAW